jgi:CubicO group peptidase (beta-lactamase class C family)
MQFQGETMKKRPVVLSLIGVIILGVGIYYLNGAAPIGAGYSSKYLCSQTFLANRDPNWVFENDVIPTNPMFKLFKINVDREAQTVSSAGFGFLYPATAVYRKGFGCTLAIDTTRDELYKQAEGAREQTAPDLNKPWPEGELVVLSGLPEEVDQERLNRVVAEAFQEPFEQNLRNTQAIVIVYNNRIVAEKYHEDFSASTPMLGWSMSKSVTSALAGILEKDGRLHLDEKAPVAAWQTPDDPRRDITINHLLRMSSGLAFEEVYEPFTDVVHMLYDSKSMADFAAAKPLEGVPGEIWNYSSGTANIVAEIIKSKTGGTLVSFNNFARQQLFDRLSMHSAIIEADASGTFAGSSYMFATARDWARIGLLYLNDGIWGDDRIFREGWVSYSTTPAPKAPKGEYGAHIWLNRGEQENPIHRKYPKLPTDLFYFGGFNSQIVAVIPSRDVVIVRLGVTHDKKAWDVEQFMVDVLETIES